jgi:hypothetical protein
MKERQPRVITDAQAEQDVIETLRAQRRSAFERVELLERQLRAARDKARQLNFDLISMREKTCIAAQSHQQADAERVRRLEEVKKQAQRQELVDLGVRF